MLARPIDLGEVKGFSLLAREVNFPISVNKFALTRRTNEDSSLRAIYNYPINLINSINGDEKFTNNDNEFKIEYQLRF